MVKKTTIEEILDEKCDGLEPEISGIVDDFCDGDQYMFTGKNNAICRHAQKMEKRCQKHPRGNGWTGDVKNSNGMCIEAETARAMANSERTRAYIAKRQFNQLLKHAGDVGIWKLERESMLPVSDVRSGSCAVMREFHVGTLRVYAPRLQGERRGKYD